jgi:transcriptional regulator with XRE-family HTH domain
MPLSETEQKAFYEELGRRIRTARKKRNPVLTQEELGRVVGLTRTSITNVEKGRQKVPIHTLAELALTLQVDAMSLLPQTQVTQLGLDAALKDRAKPEKDWILETVRAVKQKRDKL